MYCHLNGEIAEDMQNIACSQRPDESIDASAPHPTPIEGTINWTHHIGLCRHLIQLATDYHEYKRTEQI